MVICFSNRDRHNRFTTEYNSVERFQEENPYANVWFAFNEKDDVSKTGIENEKCPICNGYIQSGKTNYYCSNYKNGCKLNIPYILCGKKLTQSQLLSLIRSGKTGTVKGFTSKSGKTFDAVISLNKFGAIEFVFPHSKGKEK